MIRRDFRCPGPVPAVVPPPLAVRPAKFDRRRSPGRTGEAHPLLAEVEAYQRRHAVSDCTMGIKAAGDPNLIGQMREGRWPREATVARVRAWMAGQGCQA